MQGAYPSTGAYVENVDYICVSSSGHCIFLSCQRTRRDHQMALYRTLYYGDMTVGVGGRVTIPQEIRDDLGIGDGDLMTVRVEESPDGTRQMVMWRAKEQRDEGED